MNKFIILAICLLVLSVNADKNDNSSEPEVQTSTTTTSLIIAMSNANSSTTNSSDGVATTTPLKSNELKGVKDGDVKVNEKETTSNGSILTWNLFLTLSSALFINYKMI
jgi:hypothetical protein